MTVDPTEGRSMWVWSVVVSVLSSLMSTGDSSLTGHRDDVLCLDITTICRLVDLKELFIMNRESES